MLKSGRPALLTHANPKQHPTATASTRLSTAFQAISAQAEEAKRQGREAEELRKQRGSSARTSVDQLN